MHLQAKTHTHVFCIVKRWPAVLIEFLRGGGRACIWLFQRRFASLLRLVVKGKCLFLFLSPCFYAEYLALVVELMRAVLLALKKKNNFNSEILWVPLLELRTPKRHVSTNKNIHLQKNTHAHIHLLNWEEIFLLCETSRISSFSQVSSVDSFAVLKKQVSKNFFVIMCRAVVYSSLFLFQFKLHFCLEE